MQPGPPPRLHRGPTHGRLLGEIGGSCDDLGTLTPHGIGAMAVAGLAPAGVVFGFGAALVASGLFYGLPMAVQPVKAVSAVLLAAQLSPGAVAAIGLMIGGVLLLLGLTGLIGRAARLIPQSITAGLQLGLGIMMGWLGLTMVAAPPDWCLALVLLLGMPRLLPRVAGRALGPAGRHHGGRGERRDGNADRGGLRPAPAVRLITELRGCNPPANLHPARHR